MSMEIDGNDFVTALKAQRNSALDEAAALKASLDGALRKNEALKAELAKLKAPESDGA